jgi:hypothetical protein
MAIPNPATGRRKNSKKRDNPSLQNLTVSSSAAERLRVFFCRDESALQNGFVLVEIDDASGNAIKIQLVSEMV